MSEFDKHLVANFLITNYALFQQYLDQHGIEPSEAELIIDVLKGEKQ